MKRKGKNKRLDVDPVDRKRKLVEKNEKKNRQKPKKKSNNWQDWTEEDLEDYV